MPTSTSHNRFVERVVRLCGAYDGHTVQDHLKSIFSKTGARTCRVLIARALGR